jgi:hypothetical protein
MLALLVGLGVSGVCIASRASWPLAIIKAATETSDSREDIVIGIWYYDCHPIYCVLVTITSVSSIVHTRTANTCWAMLALLSR